MSGDIWNALIGIAVALFFSWLIAWYRRSGRAFRDMFGADVIFSAGGCADIEIYLLRREREGYLVGVEIASGDNWPRTILQPHHAKRLAGLLVAAADEVDPKGDRRAKHAGA